MSAAEKILMNIRNEKNGRNNNQSFIYIYILIWIISSRKYQSSMFGTSADTQNNFFTVCDLFPEILNRLQKFCKILQ